MELRDYVNALRKGWKIVPVVALLVLAATAGFTLLMPKTYQSNMQFFVSTVDNANTSQLAQGNNFLQQRVKSYAELLKAPIVLQPVADSLGLNVPARSLAGSVNTDIPPDSVLIDVTVSYRSPQEAQRIAAAIGHQFPKTISHIETVSSIHESPVKVTLTMDPTLQLNPVSPRPFRYLGIGLAVGVVLGLVAVIIRHMLDTKVRTKSDVEAASGGLNVIGAIPFDSDARKVPILADLNSHSARGEAFRSLRTNLRFVDLDNHPRSIVMTSTLPGEGKTTATANLALVLAESGASVLLVEGDLRRPRLLEYMGMEGAVGLTDLLIGAADLDSVLQPYGEHSLSVLGAGQLPPNPSELLGSEAMRDLMKELSSRFDYVLVDAPPLLPVTDAAIASTMVGGVIVVAGSGLVTRDQFRQAIESLRAVDSHILGVALNRVPHGKRGYYTYHYAYSDSHTGRNRGGRGRRSRLKQAQASPNWDDVENPRPVLVSDTADSTRSDDQENDNQENAGINGRDSLLRARRAAGAGSDTETTVSSRR